ncbi:MAG: exodeoxyribonuclease VII small subunit, partial [Saprospiraceae bacterium]|nr:exodeoxyribonuclease VII small subunit [Saprospiraceae bacterium]
APESYEAAYAELLTIVEALRQEPSDLDQMIEQVKRAQELIAFCREKLRSAEEELDGLEEG